MFRRLLEATGGRIAISIDGKSVEARAGDSVAAAMLAAGMHHCRTTAVSGENRAPYCMMGVCFDCLVTVDGIGNRQGCLIEVRNGMRIETQRGRRVVE
jgi:D-hydroxyproline dehydrogenase subunit gamma